MIKNFFGLFSKNIGIDLGTSNTLIYVYSKGIVMSEPSVVAINTRTDQILAVGRDAQRMLGKTPAHIVAVRPLINGVISDFEITEKMLRYFIDRVHEGTFTIIPRPRVVIGVPLEITEVERKAVEDAAISAGARDVHLIQEAMAAAIGARLPVQQAIGTMIVDIGGGTTEIAVISLGGVVTWKSIPIAGMELDRHLITYAREQFNILLGDLVAEQAKLLAGSAGPLQESIVTPIRGRDMLTGLPKETILNDGQIREAYSRPIKQIVDHIKHTLEITPPELVADIYERGIVLSGGGALLRGLDKRIADEVQIPVHIADEPLTCVVRGTGAVIDNLESYRDVLLDKTNLESL